MEEGVQVRTESTWVVSQGSLEACVSVVLADSYRQIGHRLPRSSHHQRLELVPSQESGACQITVNFEGKFYKVHSIYISSTAQTFEVYNQMEIYEEPEYACTVHGRVCVQPINSDSISENNLTDKLFAIPQKHLVHEGRGVSEVAWKTEVNGCTGFVGGALLSSKEEFHGVEYQVAIEKKMPSIDSLGERSAISVLEDCDPARLRDEILDKSDKSIYSSSEDSWVEVKLSGSLGGDTSCEMQVAVDSICRNLKVNDHEGEPSGSTFGSSNSEMGFVSNEQQSWDTGKCGSAINEQGHDASVDLLVMENVGCADGNITSSGGIQSNHHNFYEAEWDLVEPSSWASVTIRLLSLQDKACIKVDQIIFLVKPGPPPPSSMSNSLNQSMESGTSSALLEMPIPSMLQMVGDIPHKCSKPALVGVSSNDVEHIESKLDHFDRPIGPPRMIMDPSISVAIEETCTEVVKEASMSLDLPPYVSMMMIKDEQQGCQRSSVHVETQNTQGLGNKDGSMSSDCLPFEEERIMETGKLITEEDSRKDNFQDTASCSEDKIRTSSPQTCQSEKRSENDYKQLKLEEVLERFDRLEGLCMRIEYYLQKAVECLDRRLRFLEAHHDKVSLREVLEKTHCKNAEECPSSSRFDYSATQPCSLSSGFCQCAESNFFALQKFQPPSSTPSFPASQPTQMSCKDDLVLNSETGVSTCKEDCIFFQDVSTSEVVESPVQTVMENLQDHSVSLPYLTEVATRKCQISSDGAQVYACHVSSAGWYSSLDFHNIPNLSCHAVKCKGVGEGQEPSSISTFSGHEDVRRLSSSTSFTPKHQICSLHGCERNPECDCITINTQHQSRNHVEYEDQTSLYTENLVSSSKASFASAVQDFGKVSAEFPSIEPLSGYNHRGRSLWKRGDELNYELKDFPGCAEAVGGGFKVDNMEAVDTNLEEDGGSEQRRGSLEFGDECGFNSDEEVHSQEESLYISQEFDICSEGFYDFEQPIGQKDTSEIEILLQRFSDFEQPINQNDVSGNEILLR